jgi:hypothetical protein
MIAKLNVVYYPKTQKGIKNKTFYTPIWEKGLDVTKEQTIAKYSHVRRLFWKFFIYCCEVHSFDVDEMEKKVL